ncbi:calcineurin-like phosphoesterase domain-containing protein [Hirsutella rhossiliensis]|uniref:Calcineurin-like phosphoesterase domain-containing protein n=1 Tax=Hirsutella rhossiliensis TaxID=111463 RepID=A0A9P8MVM9_9HYPO|nr:calcineurin-like phosphoesterase domain-containing protein [Hirsutella rhossiliensis]KAH0962237.1 calcineurin-like phosphoesterase domain-containing protein [Hirsutella rhossiliensis]
MDRRIVSKLHRLYRTSWRRVQPLWTWARGPGRHSATVLTRSVLDRMGRNLAPRRLLSFPHALVLVWVVILMWGERWVFDSKVEDCAWKNWEKWPKGARPHHLIFVADPQIIDPHSYPGRPWPLSALTVLITDNYMRRGFAALQRQLHPDSLFFLGDLFDGGREWKTRLGGFVDPKWGNDRSGQEKKWVKTWHRKYGDDYWLREYRRFNGIFTDSWNVGGDAPGPWQRGRKLVASLPGNHDLGFGAQVQVPVRDRFSAFFGDVNRVDVIGNHTIVSVDTVSLSADTSLYKNSHDLRPIYGPVNEFLGQVQTAKRRAVQEELRAWHAVEPRPRFSHKVEDLGSSDVSRWPKSGDANSPDWPTILLTHVPLYRDPGTPCGPHREHWPPTRPPKGQTGPYQNVLNQEDSVKLIKSVGNVTHVFSGDDHDYCELVHAESRGGVREITVKSFSMAMGVPTPGFVMASLYNPVGVDGKPMPGSPEKTLQAHLCLLPNQIGTYIRYAAFVMLTLVILAARAFLVPIIHLKPFALEPEKPCTAVLPVYQEKAKAEPPIVSPRHAPLRPTAAAATSGARNNLTAMDRGSRWSSSKKSRQSRRWGWAGEEGGPRIKLDTDFYDGGKEWKTGRGRRVLGTFGREMWTTTWRVAWMAAVFWAYLARKG